MKYDLLYNIGIGFLDKKKVEIFLVFLILILEKCYLCNWNGNIICRGFYENGIWFFFCLIDLWKVLFNLKNDYIILLYFID